MDAGIPHVVAVESASVTDGDCRVFATNFYPALMLGRTVKDAFDIGAACVLHATPGPREGLRSRFMLMPEGKPHDEVIFPAAAEPAPAPPPPPPAPLMGALPLSTRGGVRVHVCGRDDRPPLHRAAHGAARAVLRPKF